MIGKKKEQQKLVGNASSAPRRRYQPEGQASVSRPYTSSLGRSRQALSYAERDRRNREVAALQKPEDPNRRKRLRPTERLSLQQHVAVLERWRGLAGHLPGILVTVVIFGLIVFNLGVSSRPAIDFGAATDAQKEAYQEIIAEAFAALPATSLTKFTLDADGLAARLQRDYPELGGVRIVLPVWGQQVQVHIETPPRSFVYQPAGTTQTAILDSSGRILSFGSSSDLPKLQDTAAMPLSIGKQVIPSREALFMRFVYEELKRHDLVVEQFNLPGISGRVEFRLQNRAFYIKMTTQHGAAEQTGALLATLKELEGRRVSPKQYIDVRVLGRIYYL